MEFLHTEEGSGEEDPWEMLSFPHPTIQREQTGGGEQGKVQDSSGAADILSWIWLGKPEGIVFPNYPSPALGWENNHRVQKRQPEPTENSLPWHHHERWDKDWMRFVWESWDSAPTLGALGSHSQAKCDPSPRLSTGTGAFPALCLPQDPSWLCGKRREGIGREQRVPERFLEAIPLLASSLSPPRNAGRIQSGFLLSTPPSRCAVSTLCCPNSQFAFPLLSFGHPSLPLWPVHHFLDFLNPFPLFPSSSASPTTPAPPVPFHAAQTVLKWLWMTSSYPH